MQIRRSKVKGSTNLGSLGDLEVRILKLDFLDNWTGSIKVVSKSKSFRDREGKVQNFSNRQVMRGIQSLVNMRLLEVK